MLLAFCLRPIPWTDSTGSVYGPISLLCEGDWDFDEFPLLYERQPLGEHVPWSGSVVRPDPGGQRLLSFTGLGSPLLAVSTAAMLLPWWAESSEIALPRANQALGFFVYDSHWDMQHSATFAPQDSGIEVADSEARMWSVRDGVLVDSLGRLRRGELEFGWHNEITLGTGWRYQPPLPPCATLRGVDRFP